MPPRLGTDRPRTASVRVRAIAVAAVLALAASACGGGGGSDDGTVTLRFSWWGADARHETTQQVIDRFEELNPGITVEGEYTDWEGYWDRLATTVAGNDAPDIITHEERYLRDYASRGALLDLNETEIDTSQIDPLALDGGELDGGMYGIATGVNAFAVVADPQAFEDAGVEMPDDETWTWEDYMRISEEISQNSEDGFYGSQDFGFTENAFNIFARQRGESLYTADGSIGFSPETLEEWFQMRVDMMESGATPPASLSVESDAGGPDLSLLSTNTGAMGSWWTNQLGTLAGTAGRDLELLRFPGESEGERTGMYYKPAMYYTISARTEHPEEAALFVDFLLNDPAATELILSDRGLPANMDLREQFVPEFPEADAQSAEFLASLEDHIVDASPVPPIGAGEVELIMKRVVQQVLFGELTPAEGAQQFITDVEAATGE
ncbi:ABC transporter substrate-binding protein [Allonocardiopsis opalescens]|uniref:Carbohydrate ABC transporter substrate-binding protein (CUT1 family) n=1 Tax=Allonocardiopsis opalescens TaxID=1144618 RepID=A0A2T0QAL1_9ACTN|nr:extracellular solute-binding protein [Allonocardiopsis opalescens]PRY00850.1 carbohydrate ABC transporter substrate-binding protein (CUT1 family) [Allonocardiopsis opalescens]